jgi:hypothetical protein
MDVLLTEYFCLGTETPTLSMLHHYVSLKQMVTGRIAMVSVARVHRMAMTTPAHAM